MFGGLIDKTDLKMCMKCPMLSNLVFRGKQKFVLSGLQRVFNYVSIPWESTLGYPMTRFSLYESERDDRDPTPMELATNSMLTH